MPPFTCPFIHSFARLITKLIVIYTIHPLHDCKLLGLKYPLNPSTFRITINRESLFLCTILPSTLVLFKIPISNAQSQRVDSIYGKVVGVVVVCGLHSWKSSLSPQFIHSLPIVVEIQLRFIDYQKYSPLNWFSDPSVRSSPHAHCFKIAYRYNNY